MGSPNLYVFAVHPLDVMTPIADASTVHVPTVDRSVAPDPTLTTMWLWGSCQRYSSTTPRSVMFLLMSNIAREWWASVDTVPAAIPTDTNKASNGGRARDAVPAIISDILASDSTAARENSSATGITPAGSISRHLREARSRRRSQ